MSLIEVMTLARVYVKNIETIIEGTIDHILNIVPKEEKRIEGLKRLTLASYI